MTGPWPAHVVVARDGSLTTPAGVIGDSPVEDFSQRVRGVQFPLFGGCDECMPGLLPSGFGVGEGGGQCGPHRVGEDTGRVLGEGLMGCCLLFVALVLMPSDGGDGDEGGGGEQGQGRAVARLGVEESLDGGAERGSLPVVGADGGSVLRAPVAGRRRPHPVRHGRRARRFADRVRTGRPGDRRNRRSTGISQDQAFLVSQKILSISAMSSSAFSPVFGSVDALAALRALRVSLTSWCSWGYFSKCGALK